jgi:hypothetical protein
MLILKIIFKKTTIFNSPFKGTSFAINEVALVFYHLLQLHNAHFKFNGMPMSFDRRQMGGGDISRNKNNECDTN